MITTTQHQVVVIGGGQAGLVTAALLAQAGTDYVVVDDQRRVGESWARRWDSLRLVTPARYATLPSFASPWPPDYFPTKNEVARYLAVYAAHHQLRVRHSFRVEQLETDRAGAFIASGPAGVIVAAQVVVATGAYQKPWIPNAARGADPGLVQLHSDDYRTPAATPGGRVLVVGAGNSGVQIALELARAGREVHLACGGRLRSVRQVIAGRDLFWWMTRTAIMRASADGPIGRRLPTTDPVIGISESDLRSAGIVLRGRVSAVTGTKVTFADDSAWEPDTIVWATGYRPDDAWITIPGALGADKALLHDEHRSRIPGLHVIGRPRQRTRGSSLLGFVTDDAQRMVRFLTSCPPRSTTATSTRRSES